MATADEVAVLFDVLFDAVPTSKITPRTIDIYCVMFADTPTEQLVLAAKMCIARRRWFPTVSELFDAIDECAGALDGEMTAIIAWGQVQQAIVRQPWRGGYTYGNSEDPHFDDPVITRVVRGFGWRNLCLSEDGTADRAHFLKAYEAEVKRERAYREMQRVPEFAQLMQTATAQLTAPTARRASP